MYKQPDEMKYDFTNITILIAEDDAYSQLYLSEIFKPTNARIIMAGNGQEAVDQTFRNPDIKIVLLDINMPVMNGLDAARVIKRNFKEMILIAQTAYSMPNGKEDAFEAGFDEFISKPFRRDHLFEKIRKHIN